MERAWDKYRHEVEVERCRHEATVTEIYDKYHGRLSEHEGNINELGLKVVMEAEVAPEG